MTFRYDMPSLGAQEVSNGINVFDYSAVFQTLYGNLVPTCKDVTNGCKYSIRYFLFGGIYPKWTTFKNIIWSLRGPKAKLFVEYQEAIRKDVERASGVL